MAFTYILECADGSFNVGSTIDLARRLEQHDAGRGAAYTRRRGRRPVQLVWAHEFASIEQAFGFEKQIQGWGRAKRSALIEGRIGDLAGLARRGRSGRGSSGSAG
ncbi:GIY-YIG nuclease family protein [Nocardioides sp.]|uniref:GIY-YIG nuclease family protein n=1 Tax=Nocardioides sp. TaxID=35761 RepID=UPI00351214FE